MSALRRLGDSLLEASIVGSFSRIGYTARRSMMQWESASRMDGQIAIVTGATSGIGEAAAIGFARLGARVLFMARDT